MKYTKFKFLILLFIILNILKIQGQTFTGLGTGLDWHVYTICADTSTGILYAGGNFDFAGGIPVHHVAQWNGTNWDSVGSYPFWGLRNIVEFNDTIYATSQIPGGIMRWDGSNWKDIGNTYGEHVNGLFATDSLMYISGWFESISGVNSRYLAIYDGNNFISTPTGADSGSGGAYNSIVYNNDIYLAGNYNYNSQNPAITDMAFLQNGTWLPIGNGIQSLNAFVSCFTIFQNKLVIGGTFQTSWGDPGNSVLLWDGTSLSQLGAGVFGDVMDMIVYNNELYVAGSISNAGWQYGYCLQKWNGSQWSNLGLIFNGAVGSLAIMNNELYVAGAFTQVNGIPFNRIMKMTLPVSDEITTLENKIFLYPNPVVSDVLEINYSLEQDKTGHLEILNSTGQVEYKKTLPQGSSYQKLNIPDLSDGIYLMRLKSGNNTAKFKFVKL